jgi:glucan phosphorylase
MNGGLNLSILDEWWLERYVRNGFAIGNGDDTADIAELTSDADRCIPFWKIRGAVVPIW